MGVNRIGKVDPTQTLKPGFPVVVWRVDVPFLTSDNWKYEGSKAKEGQGAERIPLESGNRQHF